MNLFDSQVDEIVCNVSSFSVIFQMITLFKQASWAIQNIAGTGSKYRDMCLEKEYVNKLLQMLERFPNSNGLRNSISQAMVALCYQKPYPDWEKILPALPVFQKHISTIDSPEILENALWCIGCIASIVFSLIDLITN